MTDIGVERRVGGKVSSITSFNLLTIPTHISGLIAGDSSAPKLPPAGTQIKQAI